MLIEALNVTYANVDVTYVQLCLYRMCLIEKRE